ncbi:MAG: DMT family transporter [Actinomycetota bacterium]
MSEVSSDTRRATTRRDELAGAGLTVAMAGLFSGVVIFGKAILDGELPFVILSIRFTGTAVVLGLLVRATGRALAPEPGERLGLVLAGIFGYGTEAALYFSALNHGSAAAVTLLFYTYPVIVMLVSIAIERRAPAGLLLVALGLAVAGSAIVVIGGSGVDIQPVGIVLSLGCATAYSGYLMGTDRVLKRTNPMTAGCWLAGSAAIANVAYALLFRATELPEGGGWQLAGMVVFTAGAFVCMLAGLQRIGAVRNAIIGVLEPLSVAVLAWAFLSEPISAPVAIGGTLILGGAVCATLVRTTRIQEPAV